MKETLRNKERKKAKEARRRQRHWPSPVANGSSPSRCAGFTVAVPPSSNWLRAGNFAEEHGIDPSKISGYADHLAIKPSWPRKEAA